MGTGKDTVKILRAAVLLVYLGMAAMESAAPVPPKLWLGTSPSVPPAQHIDIPLRFQSSTSYLVQASNDLAVWEPVSSVVVKNESLLLRDRAAREKRFYRFLPSAPETLRPANDDFSQRILLSGSRIIVRGHNHAAGAEPHEPAHLSHAAAKHSVWWSWTPPFSGEAVVAVRCVGNDFAPIVAVYTGASLETLERVPGQRTGRHQLHFQAHAQTICHVAVDGLDAPGAFDLVIGAPPRVEIQSLTNGTIRTAPGMIEISGVATDPEGDIAGVDVYESDGDEWRLAEHFATGEFAVTRTHVPAGIHLVRVTATNRLGIAGESVVQFVVRPANDDFAGRILVSGANLEEQGTNAGAGVEPGEPHRAGLPARHSVWWSWQAPASGPVIMRAGATSRSGERLTTWLTVYAGDMLEALETVAEGADGLESVAAFDAQAGVVYAMAIDSWSSGDVVLRIEAASPASRPQAP